MICPQCGSDTYTPESECRVCGFRPDQAEVTVDVRAPIKTTQRDIMNGVGLGCSTLCFLWFFVETAVYALAIRNPALWSTLGPVVSVGLPLVIVTIAYLLVRRKPSAFAKGLGYSLLIALILAVIFGYIGTKYHDYKPSKNPAHNGFE